MTPVNAVDMIEIEKQARALRAACIRNSLHNLFARLRPSTATADARA